MFHILNWIETGLVQMYFQSQHTWSIVNSVAMHQVQLTQKSLSNQSFLLVRVENSHDQLDHKQNQCGELIRLHPNMQIPIERTVFCLYKFHRATVNVSVSSVFYSVYISLRVS